MGGEENLIPSTRNLFEEPANRALRKRVHVELRLLNREYQRPVLGIAFAGHEVSVVLEDGEENGALKPVPLEFNLPAKPIVSVEPRCADQILEARCLKFDLQIAINEDSPDRQIELLLDRSYLRQAFGSAGAVELLRHTLQSRLQRCSLLSSHSIHNGGKKAAKGIRLKNLRLFRKVANRGHQDKKWERALQHSRVAARVVLPCILEISGLQMGLRKSPGVSFQSSTPGFFVPSASTNFCPFTINAASSFNQAVMAFALMFPSRSHSYFGSGLQYCWLILIRSSDSSPASPPSVPSWNAATRAM